MESSGWIDDAPATFMTNGPMSLLRQLKEQTTAQHQRLHEVVDLKSMTSSRSQYGRALQAYYRIVAPLESALRGAENTLFPARAHDSHDHFHWHGRLQKSRWLADDLQSLQQPLPAAAQHWRDAPLPLDRGAAFIGCAYVMEGMTLGATRIAPLIGERLGLGANDGARFFHAYGDTTHDRWRDFRNWAENQDIDTDDAVLAAQQTFDAFEATLGQRNRVADEVDVDA